MKNLTTAEGGALTWKGIPGISDEELYHWFMLYTLHGQSKDALSKMKLGSWEYDIVYPAYKCNMTDLTAAMGLVQLQRFDGLSERRKHIIREYDKILLPLGIDRLEHFGGTEYEGNGHLYLMRIPGITESKRNEIIVKMAEAGVACNVHFKPLPMHTAYKNLGFSIKDFPWAYRQYANEITLPLHTLLTDEEVAYVAQTMKGILEGEQVEKVIDIANLECKRVFETDKDSINSIYNIFKECGEKMFLEDGLLHWADPLPVSTIREECLSKETYLVVDKTNSHPVAFFSISEYPLPYFDVETQALYVSRLAVSPSLWKKGIGTYCFNYALKEAQKRGCSVIRNTVYEKDARAIEFFKHFGYKELYKRTTKHFVVLCLEKLTSCE